ncbi:helix-turn-helix transcriptional regulator [Paenibacillus alvei]|uniref:helix-turn-helix domain-containing protein n=1 Tax=Paenibacillus alvei TaxID=44250 RepID=UPI001F504560|nr:helix-turn-helix transcriptional regulator [Paenibacillus alvei]MCY9578740.1 helix-turn-helix domain-containing protein [Paenibacillus alvei]MCY9583797.1 helix-turn-helix domain-containing protein [Paenibacillus alvei]
MKAAPIIKTIGELIQDTRRASNMTLTQLSELSGINKGTISRIENGDVKRPEFSTAYPLATALGIPFETLLIIMLRLRKGLKYCWACFKQRLQKEVVLN